MIINIVEIMDMLPHRYPFLLIDRVLEFELNKSISGIKNVTFNEPQFTGHFPNNPVMPGVLIIESMAQLSAILVAKSMSTTKDKEILFMAIEEVKFRKIIQPGDTMYIQAEIKQSRQDIWKFAATVMVDNKLAAEGKFTAMVKYKDKK